METKELTWRTNCNLPRSKGCHCKAAVCSQEHSWAKTQHTGGSHTKMRATGSLLKNSWSNILKNNTYYTWYCLLPTFFLRWVFLKHICWQPSFSCTSRRVYQGKAKAKNCSRVVLFYNALSHLCSLEPALFDEFWITTQHKQQQFHSKYPYLQSSQLSFPVCWSPEPFQYPS